MTDKTRLAVRYLLLTVLCLCISLVTVLLLADRIPYCGWKKPWLGLILCGGFMLFSLLCFPVALNDKPYGPVGCVIASLLNAVGSGCAMASYYTYRHLPLTVGELYPPLLIAVLFLLSYTASALLCKGRLADILLYVLQGLYTLVLLLNWADSGLSFFSLSFFLSISVFAYGIFAKRFHRDIPEAKETVMSFAALSFCYAIVVLLVVLLILSAGDFLDSLDFGGGKKDKKKTAKK